MNETDKTATLLGWYDDVRTKKIINSQKPTELIKRSKQYKFNSILQYCVIRNELLI